MTTHNTEISALHICILSGFHYLVSYDFWYDFWYNHMIMQLVISK